jgi:FkbM family methyltransferase
LVDAGANVGLAAVFWKWRYGNFRYLGFEPDPAIAACCRENLRAWEIDGEVVEAAVAGREGEIGFQSDGADGGHTVAAGASLRVPARVLSGFLREEVDLLKIDIEGAEGEVLREIESSLPHVRALFVEWHSRPGQPGMGAAVAQLETAGFDCYLQIGAGPRQPFLAREPVNNFVQQVHLYAVRP